MLFKALAFAAAVGTAVGQRPADMSICDYYTTALLMNNTAVNQKTLLTLVVNTAVIGNYTTPNMNAVPGILAAGKFNGTDVNLAPYFSGALASTNTGGMSGMSVNFLDGGGAAPLMKNMPANDTTSHQYTLLTHLYEYFGGLLNCSMQGKSDDYAAYDGSGSMYEVHKFMDLSAAEVGYFIQQVALSAQSFGVTADDLMGVGTALNSLFGNKCAAATTVIPSQGDQLQAICIDDSCPTAPNATCDKYDATMKPAAANSSNMATSSSAAPSGTSSSMPSGTSSSMASGTGSATQSGASSSSTSGSGAATVGFSLAAVFAGFAALFL